MFVFVLAGAVFIIYFYKLANQTASKGVLLPWHIILISFSYLGLLAWTLIDLKAHFGEGPTWRIWTSLIFYTAGDAALIFMVAHMTLRKVLVRAVLDQAKAEVAEELLKQQQHVTDKVNEIAKTTAQTAETTARTAKTAVQTSEKVVAIQETLENGRPISKRNK